MTLLQILSIFSSSPLLNVEIVLIILVIVFQLGISIRLHAKIKNLQSVFQERLFIIYGYIEKRKIGNSPDFEAEIEYDEPEDISTGEIVKLSLVETQSSNIVMVRIAKSLNSYLINNYGAVVNFSIIKDIIDREVDVEDEGITQNISTPLYMGLAATMIGIILGLWAMPNLDGDEFSKGLGSLIDGVKAAMIASFIGLVCTTILTSFFYKKAKHKVLKDKNNQLSYLQAKLLPELVRAEDTGVSGLKASIDH
ncbi:MAG: MotA/TolQ/ExbB proton channel family protein, partial [Crocinitomicaceae bacterium]